MIQNVFFLWRQKAASETSCFEAAEHFSKIKYEVVLLSREFFGLNFKNIEKIESKTLNLVIIEFCLKLRLI